MNSTTETPTPKTTINKLRHDRYEVLLADAPEGLTPRRLASSLESAERISARLIAAADRMTPHE